MSKKGFPDDYIQNNPIRYNTALPPIFHLTIVIYVYCLPTYSVLVSQYSANNSESLQIVFLRPTGCSPTRTRSARVRCFRLFAFTSSPFGDKKLWNNGLSVKASPDLPSPVKAKKRTKLHPQVTNCQAVRTEGEG